MPSVISASALVRHCGYQRKLGKARPRTPGQQEALDKGTAFHALVSRWLGGRSVDAGNAEALYWLQDLRATWRPACGVKSELAVGLDMDGVGCEVDEPQPHVYVASDGRPLLTAGRADLAWDSEDCQCFTPAESHRPYVAVADLKTGRSHLGDPGSLLQLMSLGLAYASLKQRRYLDLGIYYARDAVWEWSERIDLDEQGPAMLAEVREAATLDETPRPGPWCGGCWERKGCSHQETT